MLTQKQIEDKGFTLLRSRKDEPSNDGSYDLYIADRKTKNKQFTDITYVPLLFAYYTETGVAKMMDYFNEPIQYREYYFIGYTKTEKQLNEALDSLIFTIEKIDDISDIKIDYP